MYVYNHDEDEYDYKYPNVFESYIFTIDSKSFKGHIKVLAAELARLTGELGYNKLVFLGDTEVAWLSQENRYDPVKKAQEYLEYNKVGKGFNGSILVEISEVILFIRHLSWMIRCNASLPCFYFIDGGQNLLGYICQYGNLHVSTLNKMTDNLIQDFLKVSSFRRLAVNNCYNRFGKTSAIPGRQTKIEL
ncbi:hypothetical protein [Fibrella aestuarina]|uniref:hypothetical protein n=1 Tax=Fibrella aestuarina TaxID=651143 RepID=UPI00130DD94B|nr:hypothetical protein [Fibrella aestuarina]